MTVKDMDVVVAAELAAQYSLEAIEAWVAEAKRQRGLENPAGYVVSRLRSGTMPESPARVRMREVPLDSTIRGLGSEDTH